MTVKRFFTLISSALLALPLMAETGDPGSSSNITFVSVATAFLPVKNGPSDFTEAGKVKPGVNIQLDQHPNPVGVYHGIYQVEFKLDPTKFDDKVRIDLHVKKPNGVFKKVAEITPGPKPVSGDWVVRYYWNTRQVAFDWNATDAQSYIQTGNIQLKFKAQ